MTRRRCVHNPSKIVQLAISLLSTLQAITNLIQRRNLPYLQDDISQFRGILIDTEQKSVQKILQTSYLRSHLRKKNLIVGRAGCGSNWSCGYFGNGEDKWVRDEALESIRIEIEKLEKCPRICLFHSLAGGTGSGLGLRLVEDVPDELGLGISLSFSVVPHQYGDSPLQTYNTLLCLGRMTQLVDGIVLLSNDWLMVQSQPFKSSDDRRPDSAYKVIGVEEMNCLAAEQLSSLLTPCSDRLGLTNKTESEINPHCVITQALTAMPEARLTRVVSISDNQLNAFKVPHLESTWDKLHRFLIHQMKRCPIDATWNLDRVGRQTGCRPLGTLAALLVHRAQPNHRSPCDGDGSSPHEFDCVKSLKQYVRPVTWTDFSLERLYDVEVANRTKSLTFAFNSCCITEDLNSLLIRAMRKFEAKAYIHWYERFGCSKDTFEAAFELMRQIIKDYEELNR